MISDVPNLAQREFNGHASIATRGEPVYGEQTSDGWREWSAGRSKVAGMLERGMDLALSPETRVLYLGAASGTTVSHLADIVDVVYAVEFAPRPMRELVELAETRSNVIPLLKDAREPDTYAHIVESAVDLIVQDVATRDQAAVARVNRQFLAPDGQLALAIKARSADVTAAPDSTFEHVVAALDPMYTITERVSLEPEHLDHEAIIGHPADQTEAL